MLQTPSEAKRTYGYMWWLNNVSIFSAVGFGGNYILIDQEHDLLIVTRWLEPSKRDEFLIAVINSVEEPAKDAKEMADAGAEKTESGENAYSAFTGLYNVEFGDEKVQLKFTTKNNKLWAQMIPEECPIGELTADENKSTLFRVTTIHGEHWGFEFLKDEQGEFTYCNFIDEDEGASIEGTKIDQ